MSRTEGPPVLREAGGAPSRSFDTAGVIQARRLRAARRFLRLSPGELERHQVDGVNRLLEAALRTRPYRQLYGTDGPIRITGTAELGRLPVMNRSMIASFDVEERLSEVPVDPHEERSSGTTGETLISVRSGSERTYESTILIRQLEAQGIPLRARHLTMALGDARAPFEDHGLVGTVGVFIALEEQIRALRTFRPQVLSGYPSPLIEMAEVGGGMPVDALLTFGEAMASTDRAELRRHYGVEPLDVYATSEAGRVAWECSSREGYHVNADGMIVEIVDQGGRPVPPGDSGDIVLTSFWNPTTPVVRYLVGDVGSLRPAPCSCGITLPLLGPVEGRANDRPVAYDGRRVSPSRFILGSIGLFHRQLRRYRVVQRDVGDFLMEVIWKEPPPERFEELVRAAFARGVGGPVNVEIREVETLSRPHGKKMRVVETLLGPGEPVEGTGPGPALER